MPQKRISVAYATAGVSLILMAFGIYSTAVVAGVMYEQPNVWIAPNTTLTPFYSNDSNIPAGYILDQDGHQTICRIEVDRTTYTCTDG